MKRLLFVSNLFPDQTEPYRGLDNVTVLHALRERGWEVRVVSPRPWFPGLKPRRELLPRPQDEILRPEYLPVLYLPKIGGLANHRLMASALRRILPRIRREFAWDVALSSWLFPDGWAAWQAMRKTQAPVVLLAQGSDVHRYMQSGTRRRAILAALAGTSGCITRSRSLAIMLGAHGAENDKLHPIHNGIDTSVFHFNAVDTPEVASAIPAAAKVLLFVGNLLPVKDPVFLLQAFAALSGRLPSTPHLVLAGKGPLADSLKEMAAKLGLSERVHFLGPQTAPQIAAWMRRADALVMTSRNEGLPNVVLEAQACGLPVIATDVGGIHEVIDAEWKGRLTPPNDPEAWVDAAVEVLSRPADRGALANIGSARTWPAAAEAYEQVLMDAIGA
ncbi:MAG: glycosyltransferase [Prosthecobacter sp.]